MALKAQHNAICHHCMQRRDLYVTTQVLRYHKTIIKISRCPGSCTKDYSDVRDKYPSKPIRNHIPCRLPAPQRSTVPLEAKPQGIATKRFRMQGFDWIKRWERMFGIKISKEQRANIRAMRSWRF